MTRHKTALSLAATSVITLSVVMLSVVAPFTLGSVLLKDFKYWTWVEVAESDKRPSLVRNGIDYAHKKFVVQACGQIS